MDASVLDVGGWEVRASAADSEHTTQGQEENILSTASSVKKRQANNLILKFNVCSWLDYCSCTPI